MVAPDKYLLKFDLSKFQSDLEEAGYAYTEFGSTIQNVINETSDGVAALQRQATGVHATLETLSPKVSGLSGGMDSQFASISRQLDPIAQYGERIAGDLNRLKGIKPEKAVQDTSEATDAIESAVVAEEHIKRTKKVAGESDRLAKAAMSKIKQAQEFSKKSIEKLMLIPQKERKALKGAASGLMNKATGGISAAGGLGAALLGAMVLGYEDTDRLTAELGKVTNVFEASGEALSSKQSRKAQRWHHEFIEYAHQFYAINRDESLAVLKTMVDAGYDSQDVMERFSKKMGQAGHDVATATIAFDAHFNMSTGTSIKHVTTATRELGSSLESTTRQYMKVAFAGQKSAVGAEKFINTVMSGTSALKQYGIDLESVAAATLEIQKHYEKMGLNPQYAGEQASKALQGLASGLGNLSEGMAANVAKRLFPGLSTADALIEWRLGFTRAGTEKGKKFFGRAIGALRAEIMEKAGSATRGGKILYATSQGIEQTAATTLVDMAKGIEAIIANQGNLDKVSKGDWKKARRALGIEGKKKSSLAKTQRRLYIAIREIGMGILRMLSGLIAVLAMGFKGILGMMHAFVTGGPDAVFAEARIIGTKLDSLTSIIASGAVRSEKGLMSVPGIVAREFAGVARPLQEVAAYKPGARRGEGGATYVDNVSQSPWGSLAQGNLIEAKDKFMSMPRDAANEFFDAATDKELGTDTLVPLTNENMRYLSEILDIFGMSTTGEGLRGLADKSDVQVQRAQSQRKKDAVTEGFKRRLRATGLMKDNTLTIRGQVLLQMVQDNIAQGQPATGT